MRKISLGVATLAAFTDSLVYALLIPVLPLMIGAGPQRQEVLGVLVGVYGLAVVVFTPLAGILIDRVGNRIPMMIGLFALAASTILLGFTSTTAGLVMARTLQGVSCAITGTASLALLATAFPADERGKAMGIWTSGNATGTLLGPPLGGLLYQSSGIWGPILLGATFALLDGLARGLLGFAKADVRSPAVGSLVRSEGILDVCWIAVLGASGLALLEALLPLHVQLRFGASPVTIGAFFVVATVAYAVTSPIVGAMERRLGKLRGALLGLLALGTLQPLFALAQSLWLSFTIVALIGAAVGLTITPVMPALAELVDDLGCNNYGTAYSLFNTAFAVGMTIGPTVGTLVVARLGPVRGLGVVSLIIVICALLLFRRLSLRSMRVASE